MKITNVTSEKIPGVKLINFDRFLDSRGYFSETYRILDFINKLMIKKNFLFKHIKLIFIKFINIIDNTNYT